MLSRIRTMFAPTEERDQTGKPVVTLARALTRGWLEVWYQPKVALHDNRIIGAEGLIRVRHPEIGIVPPGVFLPGASSDDMLAMTEHVIATALRDWNACAALGVPELRLAVNVPADAFVKLPIVKMIREGRPRDAAWPGLLLEVTEDQVMHDLVVANEVASALAAENCALAVDDFGAGYSSLARLRQLPFAELKIDRAYVAGCDSDRLKGAMLETIVELAQRFGLKTVAEGIETAHESHRLQGLGCIVGQGYLFAKPMSMADFVAKLEGLTGKRLPVGRSWNPFASRDKRRLSA